MGQPMEVGLSLGSNLGDRLAHLREARDRISRLPATRLRAQSPAYETEPVDVEEQFRDRPFLNAVVVVETATELELFAQQLREIESDIGRVRTTDRNAPRVIDVDVIYAGMAAIRGESLSVPHPRWAERRFVVQPLADVRPDLRIEGQTRSVCELLLALPQQPNVVLFCRDW